MSKLIKGTFLVHMVVAFLVGAPLLVIPGRFLGWVNWAPVDPILTRILGAALLALAWSSFRGWRATEKRQVAILIEAGAVFTIFGCVGLLRHLVTAHYPIQPWLVFGVLAAFAVAWAVCWFKR